MTLTVDARAPDVERLRPPARGARVRADLPRRRRPRWRPSFGTCCAPSSRRESLPVVELPSGAGHDAGVLRPAGVPSAMLFVRSLNGGISHSPDELSSEEDVELAVDVLASALARL